MEVSRAFRKHAGGLAFTSEYFGYGAGSPLTSGWKESGLLNLQWSLWWKTWPSMYPEKPADWVQHNILGWSLRKKDQKAETLLDARELFLPSKGAFPLFVFWWGGPE